MPHWVTRFLLLFILVAFADGPMMPAATAGATPVAMLTPLSWAACADSIDWECAALAVPLDYADPAEASIDLAVTRLPASDPDRRIGVLVFNCGGPGCAAVTFLHEAGAFLFPDEIRARFDIVGFDPRGTGASEAIACGIDWNAYLAIDPSPDDDAEWEAWLAGGEAYAAACAANGGPLLPFVGTENVVSDMESLRIALGEETISFLGLSYGTSVGARYADRYPERVRAFALDSGLPSFVDTATFLPQWVAGIELAFNAFLADCAAAMTCAFYSGSQTEVAFDTLMVSLDTTPLAVTVHDETRFVTQRVVLDAIDETLSKPHLWPQLAAALAAATSGSGESLLALADQRNERQPDGRYAPGAEAFLVVSCLDFELPKDTAAFRTLAAKAAEFAPRLGSYYVTWVLPCVYWPAEATPAAQIPVAEGAPPILVIGATLDTQDPYQWSLDMAAQLQSGVLLTRDGTGHPSLFFSACVEDAVADYLLDLTLPAPEMTCSSANGLFERMG